MPISPPLFSIELRWFAAGELPEALIQHLGSRKALVRPGPRTDHYLRYARAAPSGVKYREGRLEVKSLIESGPDFSFRGKILGQWSQWEKRGLENEPLRKGLVQLLQEAPGDWIAVKKDRYLLYLDEAHSWFSPDRDPFPQPFCQLEWSNLEVEGRAFWTCGVEAGPLTKAAQKLVEAAARMALDEFIFPCIEEDFRKIMEPMAYPAWLRKHFI